MSDAPGIRTLAVATVAALLLAFGGAVAQSAVLQDAQAPASEAASPSTPEDEFAEPASLDQFGNAVVRVNLVGSSGRTSWQDGRTRVGVVVAPGRVLTPGDIVPTNEVPNARDLSVVVDGRSFEVSRVERDSDGDFLVLAVNGLELSPVVVAEAGFSGGEQASFGFAFELTGTQAGTTYWNVSKRRRVTTTRSGFSVEPDLAGAGLVVADRCGRLVGFVGATGERRQLAPRSPRGVTSIRRTLTAASISFTTHAGVCADAAVRDAVRQRRTSLLAEDVAARSAAIGEREAKRREQEAERAGQRTQVMAAAVFGGLGAVGAFFALVAGRTGPRRRLALVLICAGCVPTAGGLALDALRALSVPLNDGPAQLQMTCQSDQGDVRQVTVQDYGLSACVNDGTDAVPYILVASPDGNGAVFERRIRPGDATRDGADVTIEIRRMSLDGKVWTTRRGVIDAEYEPAAKGVFRVERDAIGRCTGLTADREESAAVRGLRSRRAFTEPHLRRSGERVTRSYTCLVRPASD